MTVKVYKTPLYDWWVRGMKDFQAQARVLARVRRLELGNPGDVKPVGQGVSEMRIDYGPGYRVYYKQHGTDIVLLLCGGSKATQATDIKAAKSLAMNWKAPDEN